jgi:tetratricopeptide (TPR) repeat protein
MLTELSCRRLIVVKTQNGEEILSIHRSLQQKILKDIDKDAQKREAVFAQAFQLVRKRFPLPSPIQVPEPEKWPACREVLPHVLQLQKVAMEVLPSIKPTVKLARLLSDGGINLWERGMTSEGLRLMRSAEAILDSVKCEEQLLRGNIHIIIALLIQDYGLSHIAESKDRIWKALQIREAHLRQTPPELYAREDEILLHNAWSDYGCVLLQYNMHNEAELIFQKCLTKYHEWGKETEIPYEYYKFNHHSAFCRLYHGDFAEAIRLGEEGLRMITLATGQSSATSKTRFDLACIFLQSGDLERALSLHQQVLESNLKQHGKFSFLTLQSYYAVGALHAYRREFIDAEYIPFLPSKTQIPFLCPSNPIRLTNCISFWTEL